MEFSENDLCYTYKLKKMNNTTDDFKKNDDALWAIAEKRAKFKRHLTIFAIVMAFLWVANVFTLLIFTHGLGLMTLIWSAVLVHQYWKAYHDDDDETMTQKEFEKLKEKKAILITEAAMK